MDIAGHLMAAATAAARDIEEGACSPGLLKHAAAKAAGGAELLLREQEHPDRLESARKWKQWARNAGAGGAGAAHGWAKQPVPWKAQLFKDKHGNMPALPEAALDHYQQKYTKLWVPGPDRGYSIEGWTMRC